MKGKLEATYFYEPPNKTWSRGRIATKEYTTDLISITDTEITNNIGYVNRWSNQDLAKLTRIGTWIPE